MRFFGRKRSRTREGPETPVASERRRERPAGEEAYGGRLTDEDLDLVSAGVDTGSSLWLFDEP